MFSIRSILLAAAAFATFTSAVPLAAPDVTDGMTDPGTAVTNALNLVTGGNGALSSRGTQYQPYESFHTCSQNLAVVIVKINTALHCEGGPSKVDHNVVISLLKEVLAILGTLLYELKGGDYSGCDVHVLAGLLAGLLITVVEVLALVVEIVGTVDVVLYGLVGDIGALLCEILHLVFGLVDGLLAAVVILLVAPFTDNCHTAGFVAILAILKL